VQSGKSCAVFDGILSVYSHFVHLAETVRKEASTIVAVFPYPDAVMSLLLQVLFLSYIHNYYIYYFDLAT
jgi:hypothetical protein